MKKMTLLGLVLLFSNTLYAAQTIDKTLSASDTSRVSIEHHSGEAVIRTWDKPQVHVKGSLDSRAEGYVFEKRGNEIRFEVKMPKSYGSNWPDWNKEEDELEIFVPASSFVEYETINADLNASGIHGGVEFSAVNGEVRVSDIKGSIRISTVNGEIISQGLVGNISLNTVNGSIRDKGSDGDEVVYESVNGDIYAQTQVARVKLETVNADSELVLGRTEQLRASNVNGDTRVSLELAPNGEVRASSVSGSLAFRFQKEVSARFDVNGHAGGDLRNRLTDDKADKAKYGPSRWLKFTTAEGSGRVNVSTVSGTVTLSHY